MERWFRRSVGVAEQQEEAVSAVHSRVVPRQPGCCMGKSGNGSENPYEVTEKEGGATKADQRVSATNGPPAVV